MITMEDVDAWYEAEINQARVEGKDLEKQTIALNLLCKNIPLETIAEATGLTIEQLQILHSRSVGSAESQPENN